MMTHVQRMCAGLVGAILSVGRVVRAKSRTKSRMKQEDYVGDFLNYQLLEELDFEEVVEQLALDFLVHGKSIAKVPFTTKKETVQDIRRLPAGTSDDDILLELPPALRVEPHSDPDKTRASFACCPNCRSGNVPVSREFSLPK